MQIPYDLTIIKGVSNETYENILQSEQSTKETRKEIRRIFQQVNRRIQNITKAKVISPALNALKEQRNLEQGFSKLSISKLKDWNDIKIAYSQAIEFLRNETSTASGAKKFTKEIFRANRIDIKSDYLDILQRYYNNGLLTDRERNFVENYLAKYTEVLTEFEQAFLNAQTDLKTANDRLQNIDGLIRAAQIDAENDVKNDLENLVNNFDNFNF